MVRIKDIPKVDRPREKFLKKGMQVYLEGKLRNRSWEDKEGNKKYRTEIVGDNFMLLGKKEDNSSGASSANQDGGDPIPSNDPTDDLPF